MDTAKMSHTSDDANSSDDLIAELARLMAQDAKGDSAAEPETKAAAVPEPERVRSVETSSAVARNPSFQKPTPRFQTPQSSDYSTRPSDRLDATGGAGSLYESGERDGGERASLKLAPTFRQPSSRASLLSDMLSEEQPGAAEENDPLPPFGANKTTRFGITPAQSQSDRLEADLFAGGERDAAPANERDERALFASRKDETTQPGSAPRADDDPIARLIAAQASEYEANVADAAPADEESMDVYALDDGYTAGEEEQAEDDNFGIAPTFGISDRSFDAEEIKGESRARDPLADIESLIGEAVRSGVSSSEDRRRREPELVSLPEVNDDDDNSDVTGAAMAAEAAIMAATASTQQGRGSGEDKGLFDNGLRVAGDTSSRDESGAEARATRPSGSWRRFAGPLVAAALLVVAGGALYWVFGNVPTDEGDAPVLTANETPVKSVPEATENAGSDTSRSIVFDQSADNDTTAANEQLVSRDQTADSDVARVISGDDAAENGLANRKVRTVTVRPDGTIVSGEDTLAGSEVLPVERPNVPELPADAQTAASEFVDEPIITQEVTEVAATNSAATAEDADQQPLGTSLVPVPRPRIADRQTTPTTPLLSAPSTSTPPVSSADNGAVDLIAATANQAVSQPAAAAPQASAPASGTSAPAYVQLSSQRTEAAAQQSLSNIQSRFGSLFGSSTLEVQQVDLGERGIFYRVRLPASSLDSANSICSSVKLNGGDCFVRAE